MGKEIGLGPKLLLAATALGALSACNTQSREPLPTRGQVAPTAAAAGQTEQTTSNDTERSPITEYVYYSPVDAVESLNHVMGRTTTLIAMWGDVQDFELAFLDDKRGMYVMAPSGGSDLISVETYFKEVLFNQGKADDWHIEYNYIEHAVANGAAVLPLDTKLTDGQLDEKFLTEEMWYIPAGDDVAVVFAYKGTGTYSHVPTLFVVEKKGGWGISAEMNLDDVPGMREKGDWWRGFLGLPQKTE